MAIEFGLLTLGAYLLGSVPLAYLVAKWSRGIDIRQYGSGHTGAGNLRRTISMKAAVPIGIYDFFKGILMVYIARWVGLDITQQVVIGLAAIIGHNWPIFLRFNGGRGVATSIGVAFILMPWGIAVFAVMITLSLLTKSTPLPILLALAALPPTAWGLGQPPEVTLGLLAIFLLIVIRRLTPRRAAISASLSYRELLINRLLFDRDIRDAKAWLSQAPSPASSTEQPLEQHKK